MVKSIAQIFSSFIIFLNKSKLKSNQDNMITSINRLWINPQRRNQVQKDPKDKKLNFLKLKTTKIKQETKQKSLTRQSKRPTKAKNIANSLFKQWAIWKTKTKKM